MFPVLLLPRCLTATIFLTLTSLWLCPTYGWTAQPQVTLSWVDNATNETGYKIERKAGTGAYGAYTSVGANTTTYIDGNVTAGVNYCYRVSAYNASTTSSYSNEACTTVPTPTSPLLSVSIVGQGTVSSGSTGISCLPTCSKSFATGTQVSLTPTPSAGWRFSSWSGSCSGTATPCAVTVDQAKNVTATFTQQTISGGGATGGQPTPVTIGTFRDGSWYYDQSGNSRWDGCASDTCSAFGTSGDQPVVGVWIAGTKKRIGVFRQGAWYLDSNGSLGWEGCSNGDSCLFFGGPGDRAAAGDWDGDGKTDLGVFRDGQWNLDTNKNNILDVCGRGDTCPTFGSAGDVPVVGDWNGDGKADIGTFRDGSWRLDMNNNRFFDNCNIDKCVTWGSAGSQPIVGNWSGNGRSNIGIYHRGAWQLDTNGNYQFEGCSVDKCYEFGATTHTPVPK